MSVYIHRCMYVYVDMYTCMNIYVHECVHMGVKGFCRHYMTMFSTVKVLLLLIVLYILNL